MVWDLRAALLKKEEFESARLMDFEFRQRARATRLLARMLGLDEEQLVREIAVQDEAGVIALAAETARVEREAVAVQYRQCLATARSELISERGDPSPHRLG